MEEKSAVEIISEMNRIWTLSEIRQHLNSIEHFWNWIKNEIRNTAHLFLTLEFAITAAINTKRV
jgi:hypothetical protein